MASTITPSTACTVCAKPTNTRCGGCVSEEITQTLGGYTPTIYCSLNCQRNDWASHKDTCKQAQAQSKLCRAAVILQDTFLATRAEALGFPFAKLEYSTNGLVHLYDAHEPSASFLGVGPLGVDLPDNSWVKRAILSYRAGADALSGVMCGLGKELLTGYIAQVEEVHVSVLDARLKVHRHRSEHDQEVLLENRHVFLCVTLKGGSTWVVDPAGAQHAQYRPVLPFAEYSRDYVAGVIARFPLGTSNRASSVSHDSIEHLVLTGHRTYQEDELDQWVFKNVAIKDLLKVNLTEYGDLKNALVAHLVTAARVYLKHARGDPTSQLRLFVFDKDNFETLSDEQKWRVERKKIRMSTDIYYDGTVAMLF